jgi:hypothetical protein
LLRTFSFCLQGKTFSAEATSEFVRRPLYVVGGGDLGTTASKLDKALQQIFDVATAWKAIVLIDEVSNHLPDENNYVLLMISIYFFRLMFSLSGDRCMT